MTCTLWWHGIKIYLAADVAKMEIQALIVVEADSYSIPMKVIKNTPLALSSLSLPLSINNTFEDNKKVPKCLL